MNDTIIIMMNMRGSCATDGEKVHALFSRQKSALFCEER